MNTILPKPARKQELTERKVRSILTDVQLIATVAQVAENRWRNNLFDANLKDNTLRNFNRQIYTGARGIMQNLSLRFRLKDPDELEYEFAAEIDRVLSFFSLLPAETISGIMDRLEGEMDMIKKGAINGQAEGTH